MKKPIKIILVLVALFNFSVASAQYRNEYQLTKKVNLEKGERSELAELASNLL